MKQPPFFCMKTLMGFGGQDLNRITLNCPDGSEFDLMEMGEARTEEANHRANELASHLSALWVQWEDFSGLTPIDKPIMLWFIGDNAPEAAHGCCIGQVSSYEVGKIWDGASYRPREWFSQSTGTDAPAPAAGTSTQAVG